MENYKAVMPEHLNHNGFLFGGDLLKWVDEYAWIAASLDYPGGSLVTIGMDKVEFKQSVRQGTVLRFTVKRIKQGTTSVSYRVTVNARMENSPGWDNTVFGTTVTLVNLGPNGEKKPLPG